MFCKKCGTKNDPGNVYCINDGVLLVEMDLDLVKVSNDSKFCPNCGENKKYDHVYCTNCGYSFYDEEKDMDRNEKKDVVSASMDAMKGMGKKLESMDLPKFAKMEGKSFGISNFLHGAVGILIGIIFSFMFAQKVNTLVTAFAFTDFNIDPLMPRLNVLNLLDTFLIMNVAKLEILVDISNESFTTGIFLKGGFLALILIPMVTFSILGIFKSNDDLREKGKIDLIGFLTNGLTYAVFIAFIAILRGSSSTVELPREILESIVEITLTRKYSIINSFINSFLIYSMGTFIGYGISIYLNKENQFSNTVSNIFAGGRIFGLVSLVTIVIGFLAITVFEKTGIDFMAGRFPTLFKLKSVGIFLSLINMGAYTSSLVGQEETVLTAFSNSLSKMDLEGSYLFIFLGLMAFIFLLFFIHGRRSKEVGDNKFFLAPIVYGVCLFILSTMQEISYSYGGTIASFMDNMENYKKISIAGSRLLIGGILIALAGALVGYLVTGEVAEDE